MQCEELYALLNEGRLCEQTADGTRFATHCLYPSFDQVFVYVSKWGDGFRVTDGGGAATAAFRHGKDEAALISASKLACARYSISSHHGMLFAEVPSVEWLYQAVLAVANCSAMAASVAVEHISVAQENSLKARILDHLKSAFSPSLIAKDLEFRGYSGKIWPIEAAVLNKSVPLLFKPVTPHHVSISTSYTAYGDIAANDNSVRYSVYERQLKDEDFSLLRQVALLTPLDAVTAGAQAEIERRLA